MLRVIVILPENWHCFSVAQYVRDSFELCAYNESTVRVSGLFICKNYFCFFPLKFVFVNIRLELRGKFCFWFLPLQYLSKCFFSNKNIAF